MSDEITPEAIAAEYDLQEFNDWLYKGIAAGWVSEQGCMTHNPVPMREWEDKCFDDGEDPCILVLRVWRDGYEHLGS